MTTASTDSPWHGPLRLPNGVRPMVDRIDIGSVLVTIEYDPAVKVADLEEAEDWISACIARRLRLRLAEAIGGSAQEGQSESLLPERPLSESPFSADPAGAGRTGSVEARS